MKFIEIEEIKIRKFASLVDDVASADNEILTELELMSIEEITSYLRPKYDTDLIFSKIGTERSPLIKRIVIDFLLCFLWERTNSNEIPDSLQERCDKNIEFLKDIASGTIAPNLPLKDSELEATAGFKASSETVFNNSDNI